MLKVRLHPHTKKHEENIFLLDDGQYVMEITEADIMLVLVSAKEGGIYLDVDKEIYHHKCGGWSRPKDHSSENSLR